MLLFCLEFILYGSLVLYRVSQHVYDEQLGVAPFAELAYLSLDRYECVLWILHGMLRDLLQGGLYPLDIPEYVVLLRIRKC